jgi:hypothetical protein
VTLGLMTLLSREREEGERWRDERGVRYHTAAITIDSEMQKWKKQRAARESRKARPDEGKVRNRTHTTHTSHSYPRCRRCRTIHSPPCAYPTHVAYR